MAEAPGTFEITYPFSLGGISKQPAHLRYENQVDDATNALFNVFDGMSKRPGSLWLATLDQTPVAFSGGDWTQTTKTITKTGAFAAYTWSDGDYVYIRLNGGDIRWGLYKIASKTSDNAIVLTESIADTDQTGVVTSGWPTDINYRFHTIERDGDEKYLVLYGEGQIRVFDTSGREQIVRVSDGAKKYLYNWGEGAGVLNLSGADADNMVLTTSADYTLVANRGVVPKAIATKDYSFTEKDDVQAMFDGAGGYSNGDKFYAQAAGRGLPSGFYEYQAGSVTYAKLYTRWVGPVWMDYTRYNGVDAGGFGITFIESDGTEHHVRLTALDIAAATDMDDVADQIETAITAVLASVTVVWEEDSGGNRGRFIFTSPYSGAGATIEGIYPYGSNDDQWATRYPFSKTIAHDGQGSGGSLTLAERFTRIAVPGQLGAQPRAQSMPKALIRYTVGDTDDSGIYFPGEFELDNIDWEPRKSGSAMSNPAPRFMQAPSQGGQDQDGMKIADMAFHRDRLVIAAGDSIFMSQSGDLFNFYIDDATDIYDADPIDAQLSSNSVNIIEFVMPFRRSLLIFTKAGTQFELNSPDALTPTSAAVTKATSYETISGLRPVSLGDMIYFASARKDAAIVYEYYYDDSRLNNFASDVTAHVGNLLPSAIRSFASSKNNYQLFVVPTDCDQIYVYASWWLNNQKAQSAWTRWTFDDSYRIIDVAVIGNDLFMLVEDSDETLLHLEKIPIARQVI